DARLLALVSAKHEEAIRQFTETLPRESRDRFGVISGDPTSIDLGLSGTEFKRIAAEVDFIHHAAQVTYFGSDPRTAEAMNVRATREALELARAATHLRAFIHHSTAFVSGDRRGTVFETELDCGQHARNIIEATKLRAEKIVRGVSREIPTVVLRPTT